MICSVPIGDPLSGTLFEVRNEDGELVCGSGQGTLFIGKKNLTSIYLFFLCFMYLHLDLERMFSYCLLITLSGHATKAVLVPLLLLLLQ